MSATSDERTRNEVVAAFIRRWSEDRARGVVRPLDAYVEESPEHALAIAEAYARLQVEHAPGARTLTPGSVFAGYQIEQLIGRGGQGSVHRAHDVRLGRTVALKVLTPGVVHEEALARFRREAALASAIGHPGIATLFETGVFEGTPFIAMRLVDGAPLSRLIMRARESGHAAPLDLPSTDDDPLNAVLSLVEETARIVHAAHEAGVIHRDVKPGNIMVDEEGAPVLLDLGLARGGDDHPTLTRSGAILGSPAYMSPEQVRGDVRRIDRRTDVWALGAVLYESLTLRRPFEGPDRDALLTAILEQPLLRPRAHVPTLPRDLDLVVSTALERAPDRRYRTALDLAEDIRRVRQGHPVRARRAGPVTRLVSWTRREPVLASVSAAALLALVAALVVSSVSLVRALDSARAARHARDERLRALARYDHMADGHVIARLLASADELWPRRAQMIPAMDRWLVQARRVLAAGPAYGKALENVSGHQAPSDDRTRWHAAVLEQLVSSHRQLVEREADVASRIAFAASVRRTSIDAHAAEWDRFRRSVENDPRLRSIDPAPIAGLVPLGRDADSGLWEFWHVGSGDRPRWDPADDDTRGRCRVDGSSGIVLVLVPELAFKMGASRSTDSNAVPTEQPRHDVELAPFLIGKHEVTQGQLERAFGTSPTDQDRRLPVTHVSWSEAVELARRLGLTLPTEAQWECACRAGTSTPWWTGKDQESLEGAANLCDRRAVAANPGLEHAASGWPELDDGFGYAAPVGTFRPNPFGLCDTHGNVSEWCRDRYGFYLDAPVGDEGHRPPAGLGVLTHRGGSFQNAPSMLRSSARHAARASHRSPDIGFRVSLTFPSR